LAKKYFVGYDPDENLFFVRQGKVFGCGDPQGDVASPSDDCVHNTCH